MRNVLLALAAMIAFAMPARAAPPAFDVQADMLLRSYAQADRFSGVALVAKDGKPIFRKAYGLANREWDVPIAQDTKFRIGSITKQFTAAAILQLAEQGKLSLDDPISKYYPAAPPSWAPITLKHLLTHTSGIPSYTAIPGFFGMPSRTERSPQDVVALTQDMPLEFKPGEKFNYNNTGYVLLGYVIEKVSGQAYRTYLQEHILKPLGLSNTGYDLTEPLLPHRAAGYASAPSGRITNASYLAMSLPYAAGSLYSTADDLLAWDLALRSGKVISPASVTAMFTDYGFGYGYGQFVEVRDGKRVWQHGGGINGFVSMLSRYPDQGLTVVLLSNIAPSDTGRIAQRLAELYFHPETGGGPAGPLSAAELDRYVGRYGEGATALEVTRDGQRLFIQRESAPKAEAVRELGRTFFVRGAPGVYTFADGAPAPAVTLGNRLNGTVAKRVP